MNEVTLNNGVKMPILGLGIYQLLGIKGREAIEEAINIGYTLIDTAQMYNNEHIIADAIKSSKENLGIKREDLFITTKLFSPSRSYKLAKEGIKESLNNLRTDYIDLMLIHEPYREALDMYGALEEAYNEGIIRSIGISNFNIDEYLSFIDKCDIIPSVNQVETHIFHQQKELWEVMKEHGTLMNAWSPFAAGKNNIFQNEVLLSIGTKYGKTAAQVSLRYFVERGIVVIPKSSNKERLKENIDIFDFELSDEDICRIEKLDTKKSLFGWY